MGILRRRRPIRKGRGTLRRPDRNVFSEAPRLAREAERWAAMFKNSLRVFAALLFAAFAAYSAFQPAHAGSGYGVDEIAARANTNS
jgi:hypothetical protein